MYSILHILIYSIFIKFMKTCVYGGQASLEPVILLA